LNTLLDLKAENEKKEAAEWSVGAKDNSKAKMSEDKEAEKLRKAAEKLALNAEDEASTSDVKKAAKTKKKGKDDFDMLNATLAKMPKTKAMKDAEAKAIVDAERKKKDAEAREAKEARLKVRMTSTVSSCILFRLMFSHQLDVHSLTTIHRLKATSLRN
jgi:hypothetical protein